MELTPLGWAFMLLSVGFVSLLAVWCFYKVLKEPRDGGTADADSSGGP